MKRRIILASLLCALSTNLMAEIINNTGTIVVLGGEVKPHDLLKVNLPIDASFIYTTTCVLLVPNYKNNVIVGKLETNKSASYYGTEPGITFNGKPLKDGFMKLDLPENTLVISDGVNSQTKELLFRNSDNHDSYTIRDCTSVLRIN
jgi:hypothetical protein